MARQSHFLRKNRQQSFPTHAIFIDTETHPEAHDVLSDRHYLDFGWAAYVRRLKRGKYSQPKWLRFSTRAELWDWVERLSVPKTKLYLFSHNVGFDAPVTGAFSELPARGWNLESAIIEGPPTILKWRKRLKKWRLPFKGRGFRLQNPWSEITHTILWVDTLNVWRTSLARLGESVGLPKLDMPARDASTEAWDRYGKRDVEIILAACLQWWAWLDKHGLGGFAPTLAGQAFRAFRTRFLCHDIYIDCNEDALALARASLRGGRTECWSLGRVQGPVHVVDINSMYPAIMHSRPMPTQLRGVYGRVAVAELGAWCREGCVVAEVELDTDEPAYGIVHEHMLIFPTGQFAGTLCTPELIYALEHGHITRVKRAATYQAAVIFTDFVDFFYTHRLEARVAGNAVEDLNAKLLQNSLFGKFGQSGRRFEPVGYAPDELCLRWDHVDGQTLEMHHMRALGGLVQMWQAEGESTESHPAIASHVTAEGRMQWWRLAKRAGLEHVYYGDTDSLHLSSQGYHRLKSELNPTALGKLKLEHVWEWAEYRGPKDYAWAGGEKTKGVRKGAQWVSDDTLYQTQFTSLKGLLQMGSLDAPVVGLQQKTLRRQYKKGDPQADGRVSPFRWGA